MAFSYIVKRKSASERVLLLEKTWFDAAEILKGKPEWEKRGGKGKIYTV